MMPMLPLVTEQQITAGQALGKALSSGFGIAHAACALANTFADRRVDFEYMSGDAIADIIEQHGDDELHRKWASHYRSNWSAVADYEKR